MFIKDIYYSPHQLKPVRINPKLIKTSFQKHPFLNENYIVGIVQTAIQIDKVTKIDEEHFEVRAKRKKNGDLVWVICTIHNRMDCYWVGKVHVESVK